jgi:putative nucleotidyltransferase with HDIG domain
MPTATASWTAWVDSGTWLPHKEDIIPVISTVNAEVMALALDADVSVYRIGRLVSLEQGLAARVIRLANSASIGALKRITTVNEAIVRVGTEAVRQTVLAACVAERIEAVAARSKSRDLYDHAIGTAALARLVGEQSGIAPEESFVAGLLHDIGKLALLTLAEKPEEFGGPAALLGEAQLMIPTHHATVGAKLLAEWGIPEELREPVLYHHRPYSTKRFAQVTRVVYAANRLSHRYGFGCRADKNAEVLGDPQIYSLGLGEHWLTMLDRRAPQVLTSARRLMG